MACGIATTGRAMTHAYRSTPLAASEVGPTAFLGGDRCTHRPELSDEEIWAEAQRIMGKAAAVLSWVAEQLRACYPAGAAAPLSHSTHTLIGSAIEDLLEVLDRSDGDADLEDGDAGEEDARELLQQIRGVEPQALVSADAVISANQQRS